MKSQDGSPILRINQLIVGYGRQEICGPLDLTMRSKDSVVIVGANGTGKSTLLRTIAGRQLPLAGDIYLDQEIQDESSTTWRNSIASLFEDEYYFPNLTVSEHLELVARAHNLKNPLEVVDQEIAEWGLFTRRNAEPTALSSGQRRRLLLASIFVRPSRVMILDEPEQRLDDYTVKYLVERLKKSLISGKAILVATHDKFVRTEMANTLVTVGERGQIECSSTVTD